MFKGGAGKLDRLMTLQRLPDPDGPKNDEGELTELPVNEFENVRCAYEPLGGRAFPEREKRHAETTARFRLRYRSAINVQILSESYRVLYIIDHSTSPAVTRRFRITGADVIGRRDEIHIEVSEIR